MSRRPLYRLARALSLTAGILGILFLFLHSTPVASWVLRTLIDRLSAFGAISIGSLEYRLWRGEVSLRAIRIEPTEDQALVSVEVEELHGRWVPFRRIDVTAIRPVARFRARPEGSEPENVEVLEPSVPSWLSSLRVVDGEIRIPRCRG